MSKKATYYEIYDEESGISLFIKAYSFEEAEGIAATLDFNDWKEGDKVDVLDDIDNYTENT